uniref:Band 7 domain-containing protein n=1 Tax=Parascaris equorum TaxID=6256 RepID=A0A914R1S3_PAREQ
MAYSFFTFFKQAPQEVEKFGRVRPKADGREYWILELAFYRIQDLDDGMQEDWRLKYRSAFTYADYNDLDNMGYEAPKRYPQHFVGDFERLVVLRLGRAQRTRGPGATVVLPCIDRCTKVDLRVNAFNVPPMQIITVDRGLVELGA